MGAPRLEVGCLGPEKRQVSGHVGAGCIVRTDTKLIHSNLRLMGRMNHKTGMEASARCQFPMTHQNCLRSPTNGKGSPGPTPFLCQHYLSKQLRCLCVEYSLFSSPPPFAVHLLTSVDYISQAPLLSD